MNKEALKMAIKEGWTISFRLADGNVIEGNLVNFNTNGYTVYVERDKEGEKVKAIIFVDSNNLSDIIFTESSVGDKFQEFVEANY